MLKFGEYVDTSVTLLDVFLLAGPCSIAFLKPVFITNLVASFLYPNSNRMCVSSLPACMECYLLCVVDVSCCNLGNRVCSCLYNICLFRGCRHHEG